jgi:hypothetical protein
MRRIEEPEGRYTGSSICSNAIKAESNGKGHMQRQRHVMTDHAAEPSPRKDARVAGLAYLLATVSTTEEGA